MHLFTFIHPTKDKIEVLAYDFFDAQCQLLQLIDSLMDWELYFEEKEEIPLFI